jgi:hypothetical protein
MIEEKEEKGKMRGSLYSGIISCIHTSHEQFAHKRRFRALVQSERGSVYSDRPVECHSLLVSLSRSGDSRTAA